MKKLLFIIFCISFVLFENELFSAELVKIGEFNCSTVTYLKKFNISAYKLFGKNKKLLKEMKGTYLTQILKTELPNYNEAVLSTAVFKAYSKSGKSVNFTYNEISENLAKIPMIIGFSGKVKFQDSIEISGYEGTKMNEKQKSKFDDIFTNFQVYKVYLQFSNISKDSAEAIFKNNFIIFPMDKNPDRWLGDVEKIEIYQLK